MRVTPEFQAALVGMMRRDQGGWQRLEQLVIKPRRPKGPSAGAVQNRKPRRPIDPDWIAVEALCLTLEV